MKHPSARQSYRSFFLFIFSFLFIYYFLFFKFLHFMWRDDILHYLFIYMLQIYQDVINKPIEAPYLTQKFKRSAIHGVSFCPYEDVLGVGHQEGFTSLLVPGSFSILNRELRSLRLVEGISLALDWHAHEYCDVCFLNLFLSL